jgi:hypothetical protein
MATSGSACIVPQNMHLAVVDCEAISAQVSGRGCCQHIDAQAVGKRSDIETPAAGRAVRVDHGFRLCARASRAAVVDHRDGPNHNEEGPFSMAIHEIYTHASNHNTNREVTFT